jgi:hypothetical protein
MSSAWRNICNFGPQQVFQGYWHLPQSVRRPTDHFGPADNRGVRRSPCSSYDPQNRHAACGVENVAAWLIYFPQHIDDTRTGHHYGVAGEQFDVNTRQLPRILRKLNRDWICATPVGDSNGAGGLFG